MKTTKISPIIVAPILFWCIIFPLNYAQGRDIADEIDARSYGIKKMEEIRDFLEKIKQKIDSGKYYFITDNDSLKLVSIDKFIKQDDNPLEIINKSDAAKKDTKNNYNKLLEKLKELNFYLTTERIIVAKLEKELNKQYQEGRGYIEVKINKEKFSRPGKNLVRWDWVLRFDEINGVGVTMKKGWARGYRGGDLKLNKVEPLNLRIEPFGSALLSKPYMQYGMVHDKASPGKMKYIYSGIDDNGHEVKAELEITRYPR